MQRLVTVVGAMLTAAGGGSVAMAATVAPETGTVMVRKASGFKAVSSGSVVSPGAQVMVSPGGVGRIYYGANCMVRLGSGRVWTVPQRPPCEPGQWVVDLTENGRMAAGQAKPAAPVQGKPNADTTSLLIAGAVGLGAVGAVILLGSDDDGGSNTGSPPASP